ncbi:22850_t:CDS:2, partial [Gigaspora margarita]
AIIVSTLSYVIDFLNLPKEIKDAFNKQVLIAMAAPPIKFHRDMDPTSDKYLVYLYEYQQAFYHIYHSNFIAEHSNNKKTNFVDAYNELKQHYSGNVNSKQKLTE